jgi:hypothetical protein
VDVATQSPSPSASSASSQASPAASSSAAAAASPAPGPSPSSPAPVGPHAKVGGQVYLRIDAIKPVQPGVHLRGHLRANVNSAYYDYPALSNDAGPPWVEVGAPTHGYRIPITRSVSYEMFFELELAHGQEISGASETLELTSRGGILSDKLPFSEDYKLFYKGHGMTAPEPTAIVSYTITDTP